MNKILFIVYLIIFSTDHGIAFDRGYERAIDIRSWSFPRDHGSHPNFKTEWWYFTGHLKSGTKFYGFQLTFFRFANRDLKELKSDWAPDQVYLTHFTITDESESKFYKYEKLNRDSFGISGSSSDTLRVWNGSYVAELIDTNIEIRASSPKTKLQLSLKQDSPVILNGNEGLSPRGPKGGQASYYYTIPKLVGKGTLELNNNSIKVTEASVWMDHEFFTIDESEHKGWDWFAIQFDDKSTLMVYQLRDQNGKKTGYSSGTYLDKNGGILRLKAGEITLTPIEYWRSNKTNIRYPIKWNIKIPSLGIDIYTNPTVKNQELVLERLIKLNYWEGRCTVNGSHNGQAYAELVGY
jgi:predicted secreted hydrolase